ncbi:class I SAM-dependent methyltransferase [Polynucleobacter paneuropaeus]|nr:class I SAM-dependent methyltransferase [Polynucleobacter paneuropaeus]
MSFEIYSSYYDLLYSDKDYQSEVEYINRLISLFKPSASTILDLGCGTGMHAVALGMRGYTVTGVDMSQPMINCAYRRKDSLSMSIAKNITFQQGDARTFRTDVKFDVVISLFHVVSYQTTNSDLEAIFQTAAMSLKPGGILIFDYWYGPSVLRHMPEVRIKRLQNEECKILRIAEPSLLSTQNVVDVNYSIYVEAIEDKTPRFFSETHKMRYLFIPEIEALSSQLFRPLGHYAWMEDFLPSLESWAAVSVMELKG